MRVLHVIPSVAPSHGGPSYVALHLAKALAQAGIHVDLLATRADLSPADETEVRRALDGVELELVSTVGPTRLELAPTLLPALVRRTRHVDLVHIHSVFTYPAAIAPLVCRARGTPYILRPAGTLDADCIAINSRRRKRLALAAYVRSNACAAAAVQATSAREAAELEAVVPGARVVVVENGVDVEAALAVPAAGAGPGRRIGFLGRLHPKKNVDVLLMALSQIDPQVELAIAGSGDPVYEASLRARAEALGIARRVHWLGHVGERDKYDFLARCDLLAFPSLDENFGIAVAEALAAGRPVVVSPGVALAGDIAAHDAGVVVPAEPAAVARALQGLLRDGQSRTRQGENARRLAGRWAWGNVAQRTIALYLEVMDRATCAPSGGR